MLGVRGWANTVACWRWYSAYVSIMGTKFQEITINHPEITSTFLGLSGYTNISLKV